MKHLDNYAGPEPPKRISDTLMRRWGTTDLGFPVYRLVWSENVFEQSGGIWHDWDKNLNQQDRGGIATGADGKPTQSEWKPDQVHAELRTVKKYSHLDVHGWMLQRWFPPAMFGSRESWEALVVMLPDGDGYSRIPSTIPLLGAYPAKGAYVEIGGPYPKMPAVGYIEDVIADREERRAQMPDDIEEHIRNEVLKAQEREERRSDIAIRENHERIMASVQPLTSTSLEAGRWRSKMFERAGHTAHIGN